MTETIGRPTGGKPINLSQLEGELDVAGVSTSAGLGFGESCVYTYDTAGVGVDFPTTDDAAVDTAIANHVAMRDKTDAELSAEFQATSDPVRKQELRDQLNGLLPREQVPITQEEWDKRNPTGSLS
jgi:hypothetical protein